MNKNYELDFIYAYKEKESTMKAGFLVIAGIAFSLLVSFVIAEPGYNGSAPGCSGTGCHTFNDNDVSVLPLGNLEVQVTLAGVQAGENVAGELVDINGTVVDVANPSLNNPFILTAPGPGRYLVNAGYKRPTRHWDSLSVDINVTSIDPAHEPDGSIRGLVLFQNYPNPFNPITVIHYKLLVPSDVTIEVFDLFGKNITTIITRKPAGDHSINFDGSNLAGGVYLYRVQAGDYVKTKKMILMR